MGRAHQKDMYDHETDAGLNLFLKSIYDRKYILFRTVSLKMGEAENYTTKP